MGRSAFVILLLGISVAISLASAHAETPVQTPPGTHSDGSGALISGRGLRDTTDFLAKELDRRGIVVTQVGPYRVRGVELTRFVSQTGSTSWLAIHVVRIAGKTLISFVPRPGA